MSPDMSHNIYQVAFGNNTPCRIEGRRSDYRLEWIRRSPMQSVLTENITENFGSAHKKMLRWRLKDAQNSTHRYQVVSAFRWLSAGHVVMQGNR